MAETFANNAATTLDGLITDVALTITVASAATFPSSAQYRILIDNEIMIVTAGAGTTTWTVTRAAESTAAAAHANGATVKHILTAASIGTLLQTSGLLTALTAVDGAGSGVDADLLDGSEGALYLLKAGGTMTGAIAMGGQDITGIGSLGATGARATKVWTAAIESTANPTVGGAAMNRFVRADKDADGDYDALTAAAWEASTMSGTGTINWNTVFGVPTSAIAVAISFFGWDDVASSQFLLKAKSTATNPSFQVTTQGANGIDGTGIVPIAADGTSYFAFSATWTAAYLRVIGWYI